MDNEYDFTDGEDIGAENPNAWGNINAAKIQSELTGLISRINETAVYLDKFVYNCDYEKMNKLYTNMYTSDLAPGGWLQSFYNTNHDDMDKYAGTNTRPNYYFEMSDADQKAFDVAIDYYADISYLVQAAEKMRVAMMKLPLLQGYTFQRFVLNFTEAGFMEDTFHKINSDIKEISELINNSWTYFESRATRAKKYYENNYRSMSKSDLNRGYRQARIQDHQFHLEASRARDSFVARTDGTYTVHPAVLTRMEILDKYTERVAYTENIEEGMDKVMDGLRNVVSTILPVVVKNCSDKQCSALADGLYHLCDKVIEFASTSKNVYRRFKERDDESPYIFMKPLPVFSSMQPKYSLEPITSDPWHNGTSYCVLYRMAAQALSQHCREFVQREHPELK